MAIRFEGFVDDSVGQQASVLAEADEQHPVEHLLRCLADQTEQHG